MYTEKELCNHCTGIIKTLALLDRKNNKICEVCYDNMIDSENRLKSKTSFEKDLEYDIKSLQSLNASLLAENQKVEERIQLQNKLVIDLENENEDLKKYKTAYEKAITHLMSRDCDFCIYSDHCSRDSVIECDRNLRQHFLKGE